MRRLLKVFGLLAITAMCLGPVAAAQADPFMLEVDNAVMDLGGLEGVRGIDSTISPPDPSATLTGEVTGNNVTVPSAGFVFPSKEAEVSPGIDAVIDMEANEDITGTYDAGSGTLELAANLKATVAVFGSDCVISPIDMVLSTENGKPYLGEPFSSGLTGDGALSASWTSLPPVTGGGLCSTVAGLIAGPGGIWMSHDIVEPKTCEDQPGHPGCAPSAQAPEQAPMISGGPGATTEATEATFSFTKGETEPSPVTGFQCSLDSGTFEACDTGTKTYSGLVVGSHAFEVKATNEIGEGPVASYAWTITRPVPPPTNPKFSRVVIKPKIRVARRGQKVVFGVRVKNVGNAPVGGVRICAFAPKRLVRVRRCIGVGRLNAKQIAGKRFRVAVNRRARRGQRAILKFRVIGRGIRASQSRAMIRVR